MKRAIVAAVAILAGGLTTSAGVTAQGGSSAVDLSQAHVVPIAKNGVYIVVMKEQPAAGYTGEIAGLPSTKPEEGEKLSRDDSDVQQYVAHLDATHDAALDSAGIARSALLSSYRYAANGFSAKLSPEQATALSAQAGVSMVVPDTIRKISNYDRHHDEDPDVTSAAFLGLTDRKGVYASGINGEGVVVGMIDTGIWPEHPSLDPTGFGPAPATFVGTGCDFGNTAVNPLDAPFECNNKLLAAKSYHAALTAADLVPGSYLSARDDDGHGTHTSTTAAGNADVSASILGSDFGTVTGIAPRARISTYKVCWNGEGGGCSSADTAAAIDDAIADGVDVINYSIGGPTPAFSLDDLEFLYANDAGVFVSRSAGNDGPAPYTIGTAAVAPWVTAVGASTTDSTFASTVTLGDGQAFTGASVTGGVGPAPIVDAAALGNPLCLNGVGFTTPVTGQIVLCLRGTNARVDKSREVFENGGVGMVVYNAVDPQEVVTDNHFVPSVHISNPDGLAVKAYITANGATATATLSSAASAPAQGSVMAAFSSRGPNGFSEDVITPDVTAPGVNILAGNTPTPFISAPGQYFQAISGTSMSAPHVAGVYALMKQAHPEWSPAEAKSALMTSARQDVVKEDGVTPADPFDMGAGHIAPGGKYGKKNTPFNPGLVYDADALDYLGYTCETFPILPVIVLGFADSCDLLANAGVPTTAENLNLASIGVGDVAGLATVTRTVTNVSNRKLNLDAAVEAPAGFKVKVSPRHLKLQPGESKSFTVKFTRTTAPYDTFSFGSLTWEGGGYEVRSPIAVKAKQFAASALVSGVGDSGTIDIPVKFGYEGAYGATASGLVSPHSIAGTVVDDPDNDINIALATGNYSLEQVTIPAGTALTRIGIRNADVNPGADIDLYVFDSELNQVGGSGSGTSHETVDLVRPVAGVYFVVIHGFDTAGPSSPYVLYDWSVPEAGGGSLTVTAAPAAATVAAEGIVTVAWTGAGAAPEQLGAVIHANAEGILAVTGVEINVLD
jgi:subtilisin family serine protease